MADIFDRIAPDQPANPRPQVATGKGPDIFDRLPAEPSRESAPTFGQRALRLARAGLGFERGLGRSAIDTAENIGNIAAFGIPRLLERPEEKAARERLSRPVGRAEQAGKTTGDIATMFAPIPGLQEIEAPATAGRLARAGVSALRGATDVGLKTLAQTGSPREAATTAAIAGPAGAVTEVAVPGISSLLNKWAKSQYGRVLHPLGRKAKEVAEEHIPDILERGGYRTATAFTKGGLAGKFEDQVEVLGDQIGRKYQQLDRTSRTRLGPIYTDFNNWVTKEAFTKTGKVKDPTLVNASFQMLDYLTDALGTPIGTALPSEVHEVRQSLDKYVFRSGLTADESLEAASQVRRAVARSIRDQLNRQHPDLAQLNNTFHLWRSASELMQRNIRNELGKLNFARNTGMIGRFLMGAAIGGGGELAERREFNPWETGSALMLGGLALQSTAWSTVSAVTKAKIAELLVKGEGRAAAALAARATGVIRGQADKRMQSKEPE